MINRLNPDILEIKNAILDILKEICDVETIEDSIVIRAEYVYIAVANTNGELAICASVIFENELNTNQFILADPQCFEKLINYVQYTNKQIKNEK